MTVSSPELFAFILENETEPDEGVTVEHIGQNYNGSDRPKKKLGTWLHGLDHIEMFVWKGKDCCRIMDCPLKETLNRRKAKDCPRPSSSRQGTSFCFFRVSDANDMYRKATFLYEQTFMLLDSKDHFWNDATRIEVMNTLEEMMQMTKEATAYKAPSVIPTKRYPAKETVQLRKKSGADPNDPFFGPLAKNRRIAR